MTEAWRGQAGNGWDQHLRVIGSPSPPAQRAACIFSFLRCPLKTLQKCEIALEKLKNDMAVVSGVSGTFREVRAYLTASQKMSGRSLHDPSRAWV